MSTSALDPLAFRLGRDGIVENALAHAERAFPRESCGFAMEAPDAQLYYLAAENLDRASGFEADVLPLLEALGRGDRLRVIVHSHPFSDPELSRRDHDAALLRIGPSGTTRPCFPSVDYLVLSLAQRVRGDGWARLHRFDECAGSFVEIARFDHSGAAISRAPVPSW